MTHNVLGTAIAVSSLALFSVAQADWTKETKVDGFSGRKLVLITNIGKVVSGETNYSSLIYRDNDGDVSLFWNAPENYICGSYLTVKMRVDDGEVINIGGEVSTDNQSIFFDSTFYRDIFSARKVALKMEDGCGNSATSEFYGDGSKFFPELVEFNRIGKWETYKTGSYRNPIYGISQKDGPILITYLGSSRDIRSPNFVITDAELWSVPDLDKRDATISVGGKTFPARAWNKSTFDSDVRVSVEPEYSLETQREIVELLGDDAAVVMNVAGRAFQMRVVGFEAAVKAVK